ncbi:MAG: adenosine deaminase family protein [Defluviicoccus sp.]|nr:adenosine deaminase family protein [Defluviicoccus sp.]
MPDDFIRAIPKAELHLHIEGTLGPALRVALARRNGLPVPDVDPEADTQGYDYASLEEFLAIYYDGMEVLRTERDFYDLAAAYLRRCRDENTIYAELSFDPQPHLARGVAPEAFMGGILAAVEEAGRDWGVSANLILCVNRDRPLDEAWPLFDILRPWRDGIVGFGLDSAERGNPPRKFAALFDRARREGYRLTAHCDVDQENSIEHIRQCLDLLRLERIDHGVNAVEDPRPTFRPGDPGPRRLRRLRQLFDAGVRVTVNTDDPALFASGYLTDLLRAVQAQGGYSRAEIATLMRNAFVGSFAPEAEKAAMIERLDRFLEDAATG